MHGQWEELLGKSATPSLMLSGKLWSIQLSTESLNGVRTVEIMCFLTGNMRIISHFIYLQCLRKFELLEWQPYNTYFKWVIELVLGI